MNELIYSEVIPFRIKSQVTQWNVFFFIRLVWSYLPDGGKWWQSSLFIAFQIVISIPALIIDFVVLIIEYLIIKLSFHILKGIWNIIQKLLETIIKKLIGKSLSWLAVISILFIVFLLYKSDKWIIIYDILLKYFSMLL